MRNICWTLIAALCASLAFAAEAAGASGYKGIAWGASCADAVHKMEANGFVFEQKGKMAAPGQARSPQEPGLFARAAGPGRPSCSSEESDLMMDTARANPYVEVTAVSGEITVALLCRNDKFVGARLETPSSRKEAALLLTRAAGGAAQTIRADTCDEKGWKCMADHSQLLPRGDSVRYLERPIRSLRDEAQGAPLIRYSVLAETEDRALRTASVACATRLTTTNRLQKKKIEDGNQAAVQ